MSYGASLFLFHSQTIAKRSQSLAISSRKFPRNDRKLSSFTLSCQSMTSN